MRICGGSDSGLTPVNPNSGIHAAVNHPVESSRVTIEEALSMFTRDAAWVGREEGFKGDVGAEGLLHRPAAHGVKRGIQSLQIAAAQKAVDLVLGIVQRSAAGAVMVAGVQGGLARPILFGTSAARMCESAAAQTAG